MTTTSAVRIGFIGFGEVGQRFARDLGTRADVTLSAYDILFDAPAADPRRGRLSDAADTLAVARRASLADLSRTSDVVVSAVTADQTERVAQSAAAALVRGTLYLDVNSASPATKRRAAEPIEAAGADYVEGAVMGPVRAPGIRVPILAGGPAAERASERLNRLGMNLTPASPVHGRASAIKLSRSIMIKGIEALMVDCARSARHWGVERDVYASLAETFPSIDWARLADDMAERVATHGVRRAAEMREAADMLADMGVAPDLARAVADAQQRGAKPKA